MTNSEQGGYVTVTVIALLLGLSILLVSVSNLTTAKVKSANRSADGVLLDLELENMVNTHLADLIEQRTPIAFDLTSSVGEATDATLNLMLEDEGTKTVFLTQSETDLREQLGLNNYTQKEIAEIMRLQATLRTVSENELLNRLSLLTSNWSSALKACFDRDYTLFRPTRRFVTSSRLRQSVDGIMLRLTAEGKTPDQSRRGLRVIALITGRRDDPIWIFDWERYSGDRLGKCQRQGT